jgi:hypothetical protein
MTDRKTMMLQVNLNKTLQENASLKQRVTNLEKELTILKGMIPKEDSSIDYDHFKVGGTD